MRGKLHEYRPTEVPFEPGMIAAAVAVVLCDGDAGLEVLFIHRAVREGDTWSGQIAFPGGRKEPADGDLQTTAIRETREEIGVDLEPAERLGPLDDMYPRTPVLPPVVVRPFVFALPSRPAITLSNEVQDAFWVALATFDEPAVRRDVTITHRGLTRVFPAYVLGDRTIWGLTERILTPLLSLAR